VPAAEPAEVAIAIRPLTFLHIYRLAGRLAEAARLPASCLRVDPPPPDGGLRGWLARPLGTALRYHWGTSGFGAYAGPEALGWLFLHGGPQVLVVDALLVAANDAANGAPGGVGDLLLDFAERRAGDLRKWLAVAVAEGDAETADRLRARGYTLDPPRLPGAGAAPGGAQRWFKGPPGGTA
jgi:hypothetical protein